MKTTPPAPGANDRGQYSTTLLKLEVRSASEVIGAFALYGVVFRTVGTLIAQVSGIHWLAFVQALGALVYGMVTARASKTKIQVFLAILGLEWTLWGLSMAIAVGVRPYFHIHTILVTASVLLLLHDLPPRRRIALFLLPAAMPTPFLILLHATAPQLELQGSIGELWLFTNQVLGLGFLLCVSGIAMLDHARARQLAEERAEAQTLLVEDLSHELRTPIATILTAAQGAQATQEASASVAQSLGWIEESARAGGRLVERMLDLATLERGWHPEPEPEPIVRATRSAVDRLRPLANSLSISLRVHAETQTTRTVDAISLGIVLQNLVTNALHHSPPGSEVEVRVSEHDGAVRIDVEDQGEGIAAADLPHIFDRMWRGDRSRTRDEGRFGLGLSIARHHAARLGATIEVRSELRKGSVFSVVFG